MADSGLENPNAPVSAPEPATMQATGDLLREHIRHEENVVFPLIEAAMPEDALAVLGQQLLQYTS